MVKFSKELEAQLIPEWKDYFVNYWLLKKHIKKIRLSRKPKQVAQVFSNSPGQYCSDFGHSVFDPIRNFISLISLKLHTSGSSCNGDHNEVVRHKSTENQDHVDQEEALHEYNDTELSQLFSEEDEVKLFFDMLDEELEKVNRFYTAREAEFLERGEGLLKQLQILQDLKPILDQRRRKSFLSPKSSLHGGFISRSNSNSTSSRHSDYSENMSETKEGTDESSQTDEVIAALEKNGLNFIGAATRSKTKKGKPKMALRIDIPVTTPARTISAVTSTLWEDIANTPSKNSPREMINRKKIQCAEKMIRGAFVELYRGLGLLKTYCTLNMVAFTKILKKFDKVANRQASASYMKTVKGSHFISSDKVVRLMDEVESLFIKHFADNDRKKAMKFLRPQQQKDSHMVTFFVGLFTGCFVTLFVVYAILAHISGMFSPGSKDESGYMETVYPIFSTFALLSLHLFMYGCNLLMWKSTRINYTFIFEFSPKTALKYRDAFLICTSLMTSVVGALVIHLILRSSGFSAQQVDIIPGILLLIFLVMLICPLNVFYRSTRYSFLKVLRNIVFSPFYKVLMVDFFMADQLTSQIPLLRHMETTACYLLAGTFKTHHYDVCKKGTMYRELAYVISFAPYYWRAMQCARRWFEESDPKQLANLGKYVSAMVAAGARLTYAQQQEPTVFCTILVVVTSALATIYQLYWDFVQDWGFFNPTSRNPWLRDDLILRKKSIYYISIVINLVLRVAWVESVMRFIKVGNIEAKFLDFTLASLEVFRRGHWNFYRLENEHLNNVGKYRAVKAVPLPFRETDSDG
ncbi:phosphate transporter PHO1 isoform X1 [Beta vulgaris subsp. vulgaris]|uniref:phosphate transporter PHO1 isoform X1 n=1 Tax=Beta vulgaris subsp. vulgaris TaxID=3555 RepID=UPI00203697AA|nr:phosphate transporter PHO1 isoform X1 [Beta vulgaris subsp. vulgaris]